MRRVLLMDSIVSAVRASNTLHTYGSMMWDIDCCHSRPHSSTVLVLLLAR